MTMTITDADFHALGALIMNRDVSTFDLRTFMAFYGASPVAIADMWDIVDKPKASRPRHLLWACMFMKLYVSEDVLIILLDTTKNTLRKWIWYYIDQMGLASLKIIDFEKRNRNCPKDSISRMTIDGTDFMMEEPFPWSRKWWSPKFKRAGLKYEVGVSIYSGDIVWVHGPYRAAKHDISIFKSELIHRLDEGEMVEADQGYIGADHFIRTRYDYCTKKEEKEKNQLRARQETVNHRFKCFGILKQVYRHDIKKHAIVFRAVASLTQLEIDNGNCMFGCEPTTLRVKKGPYSIDDIEW